jgi:hypothetical protein
MAIGQLIEIRPGVWEDEDGNLYADAEGTLPIRPQDELPFSQQPTSGGLGTAFWNPDIQSPEEVERFRDQWADMQTTVDRMNMLDPWYQALGLTGRGLAGQMAPETQARFAFGRFTPGFATTPGFGATEAGPDVTTTFRGFAEGRPSNWTHTDWLNGMKALRNYGVIPNPIDPKDWNNMSAEDKSAQVQNHMSMLLADGVDQNIVAAWDNIKSFEQVVTLIEGVIGISRMSGSMRQVYKNGIYRELARIERDNPGLADKPAQLLAYVSLGGFNLNGLGIVPKEQNFQTPIKPGDKLSSTGNPNDQEGASGAIGGGQANTPKPVTPAITPKTKDVNQDDAKRRFTASVTLSESMAEGELPLTERLWEDKYDPSGRIEEPGFMQPTYDPDLGQPDLTPGEISARGMEWDPTGTVKREETGIVPEGWTPPTPPTTQVNQAGVPSVGNIFSIQDIEGDVSGYYGTEIPQRYIPEPETLVSEEQSPTSVVSGPPVDIDAGYYGTRIPSPEYEYSSPFANEGFIDTSVGDLRKISSVNAPPSFVPEFPGHIGYSDTAPYPRAFEEWTYPISPQDRQEFDLSSDMYKQQRQDMGYPGGFQIQYDNPFAYGWQKGIQVPWMKAFSMDYPGREW